MISFRDTLAGVVDNVGNGIGAVIMGYDGIAIDEYILQQEMCDIQLLAVEYATLLKEVQRTMEVLKTGRMEEMTISTDRTSAVVRVLNDEFFFILVLDRNGNFGKARYLLRRTVPLLREELS